MQFVTVEMEGNLGWVTLTRGKVNAINQQVVNELSECFKKLAADTAVKAVILTGQGRFFSFGLDIPEFLGFSREDFTDFLTSFAELYTYLFVYPKPVVIALNGHTIAGGCMIATACDYRLMVSGRAKISLNEVTFGSSVFAGSVEMLKACVGERNAHTILCSGAMLTADEALDLGLIDQKASEENLRDEARKVAEEFAGRAGPAFESIKLLLRRPIAEEMRKREESSITEFVEIWYSEDTWKQLQEIKIKD